MIVACLCLQVKRLRKRGRMCYNRGKGGMQMKKHVPLEKQQKSARREHDSARRGDWGAVKPVLRVVESGKRYSRKKQKEADRREEGT